MSKAYLLDQARFGSWIKVKNKGRAKKGITASLMLTPMVDMFSLLVIFLLQFFVASPDFHLTDGVDLPSSLTSVDLREAPIVSVSQEEIFVEQKSVGKLKDILKNPAPLAVALEESRKNWMEANPEETFVGEINFEAHKDIESTTISQVMAIMAAQHYGSIQLIAFGD